MTFFTFFQRTMLLLVLIVGACNAYADDVKPAVIYDLGGKFDKSFNQASRMACRDSPPKPALR